MNKKQIFGNCYLGFNLKLGIEEQLEIKYDYGYTANIS